MLTVLCAEFFATLVIGASILATAQAQELSFTLHEQLVIGDDEEAPSEYLFSLPRNSTHGLARKHLRQRWNLARPFGFSTRMAYM